MSARNFASACVVALACALLARAAPAQEPQEPQAPAHAAAQPAAPNGCIQCHGDKDLWEDDQKKFFVGEDSLAADIHWQKGLRCADCHGGDPASDDFSGAHSKDKGFRKIGGPVDVPSFCGRCHSDIGFMRKFQPSPRTDQESEYWTSGHGLKLKENGDPRVATCVSCHGHHGIRKPDDLESPVYPTKVADTCARCHSDAGLMKGRVYHGKELKSGQRELWLESVHGKAMMQKGDLAAPTCNDCHGNHGAVPPEVGSVANTCGTCHGKIASLFNKTRMKHQFEEVGLPGCATCHSHHDIGRPSDAMLGMATEAVCARCHADGKYGAPEAGARGAQAMRSGLEELKAAIATADRDVGTAERLGMEVRIGKYDLRKAHDALTNARALVHSFDPQPVAAAVKEGVSVANQVTAHAQGALEEHGSRRVWLMLSLLPILAMAGFLALIARRYYPPVRPADDHAAGGRSR